MTYESSKSANKTGLAQFSFHGAIAYATHIWLTSNSKSIYVISHPEFIGRHPAKCNNKMFLVYHTTPTNC